MLLVKVRRFELGLKMGLEADRAVRMPAEGEEVERCVGIDREVVYLFSGKGIHAGSVPFEVALKAAFHPGIGIHAVPLVAGRLVQDFVRILQVEGLETVANTAFNF